MKKINTILAVTGIRSEYDILKPVLLTLKEDGFDVQILVSGAHLSSWHGNTIDTVKKDGFIIADRVDSLLNTDRNVQRIKGLGSLITGMTQTVERVKPDVLLVVGDREEAIAACLVGNYMGVLVAHIAGGDPTYGNADDCVRMACSKLAHIHFPFTKTYADNLMRMGEEGFRIKVAGNPSFYNILNEAELSCQELSEHIGFNIEKQKYIVLLQHPLSSEVEVTREQMYVALSTAVEFVNDNNLKMIGIYPNTDPGSAEIIGVINMFTGNDNICFLKNLPTTQFINIMKNTLCLIGNSSMGILESPLYKVPVINIGNRQKGRLQAGNVEFVDFDSPSIIAGLSKACFNTAYRAKVMGLTNPYGDGHAPDYISGFIQNIDLSETRWYVKKDLCGSIKPSAALTN